MLFEVLHPITMDGNVLCESFRLNLIPQTCQFRCKITFPDSEGKKKLVDLNVYQYTLPRNSGFEITMSVRGKEMETGLTFDAYASYNPFKNIWKLTGTFGNRKFNYESSVLIKIFNDIKTLVLNHSIQDVSTLPITSLSRLINHNHKEETNNV